MEVIFGGDFFPGKRWGEKIINSSSSIFSKEILKFIEAADLRIINLEAPLTISNNPIKKIGPNLKCHPSVVKSLNNTKINLVTLANNHIFDFGEEGLKDTTKVLDENNINYIGVGENKIKAKDSIYIQEDVVFLNYSHNEWGNATDNLSGYNGYSIIDIVEQVKYYKSDGKFVCLILHRGHELFSYPSPNMVREFRFFVDSGADLIIAHHSHFYSGYEKYNNAHIFYGLGNLLFDSSTKDQRWYESFLLKVNIVKSKLLHFEILPICNHFENNEIKIMENKEQFKKSITYINQVINNDVELKRKWLEHVDYMELSYLIMLKNRTKYILSLVKRLPFLKKYFVSKTKHQLVLKNYFKCEAHNELIKEIFNK